MTPELPQIRAKRLTGSERLHNSGKPVAGSVLDFWQWLGSDLVGNTFRGALAEYIVAQAIGAQQEVRADWLPFDLMGPDNIKIEVKASAYIQNWYQPKLSTPSFTIGPKRAWDPETDTLTDKPAPVPKCRACSQA